MQIAGQTVLVTGGASGLGAGVARMLAAAGASVVIADLNEAPGQALAAELGARFVRCDVTQEADMSAAVGAAPGLAALVHCAGILHGERLVGRDGPHALETFRRVITVNLIGTFNAVRLAAAAIARNTPDGDGERGVIVCTASVAAFDGQIGQAAYAASKAGVAGLTLPLARDLSRHGIRVATIAPGLFATPMMAGLPDEVQAALGASVPFPARLGQPAEFASAVRFILETPMLNGEVIRLDGALRMAPR